MRDWYVTVGHRRRDDVPVFKDPIALFSAGWLADTFGMEMLVLIRHPAAFVRSIVRNGWDHPFGDFLAQPLMMRDQLAPFADEIERFAAQEQPLMDQAILLWNLIHHQIRRFRDERPSWAFLRHEDLSREPVREFRALYERLGLTWTDVVLRTIEEHSGVGNPQETTDAASHKRDSRKAITAWKARLTPEEIRRIRDAHRAHLQRVLHRCRLVARPPARSACARCAGGCCRVLRGSWARRSPRSSWGSGCSGCSRTC